MAGGCCGPLYLADAAARLVAEAAGDGDFAELAVVEELHRLLQAGAAAALRAGLTDAVLFAGDFDDAAAFADVVADRLFDVDVLAVLQAQMAASECQWLGVAMEIASIFLSSMTLRMSCSYLGAEPCCFSATDHGLVDDGRIGVADDRDDDSCFCRRSLRRGLTPRP